ncbi:metal ABC transporter ATP-binding protein [Rubellimicrobium rubrum]|uniref:Metal ABC transporter ATP-binding protein n=1 Tax=Rubellimicrobium rubrum TaxID=2585369 RepID=A0A5C4MQ26_9RHOB|nr:metal ABC transporter ATP-binding protein [Rubellimicrobium rubrum]TNC47983.1 metal ABC transporter ATP-binding protein [Rubellimicrobium rubrum]
MNAVGRFPESLPALADSPLAVRGLSASYGGKPAVIDADVTIVPGTLSAIVGPNGAGKSTLMKAVLGLVPRQTGDVTVFGQPLTRMRHRLAYVPQRASVDWDFPVRVLDVAMMGLHRELGLLGRVRPHHRARAEAALDRTGTLDLARRQIGQLSGGQQQRVFLARALAQGADLFLLDEPFAGVDAATEATIMSVLKSLRDEGKSVVCVHHDLSTVADYFDRLLLLNRRVLAEGPVDLVLTDRNLQATYGGRLSVAQLAAIR